jgi:hypothetical protein
MLLTFTVEIPLKENESDYIIDLETINQMGTLSLTQNPDMLKIKNISYSNSNSSSPKPESKYSKINHSEALSKIILNSHPNLIPIEKKIAEDNDLKAFIELMNKQYIEMINGLQRNGENEDSERNFDVKYEELKKDYEKLKLENEKEIHNLKEELNKNNISLNTHLLNEEIKNLKIALKEKDDRIELLYKNHAKIENQGSEKDEVISELKKEIESKYEHFEELNRYINDLLIEKKTRIFEIEKKNQELKELKLLLNTNIKVNN